MLRGAIIGLGNVALAGHLPGWLRCRDVEIVAATDVEPARRAAIEALVPTVTWYDTAESLLARERLDFVDICTPPASHGPLVTATLGSGRPVLRGKPLVIRRHTAWAVEDTATVHLTFPHASAEILLTWAADRRDNRAELIGTDGRLDLEDDTLVLTRNGRQERWPCPPAMSDGSAHPEWFDPVVHQFVGEVTGVARPDGNLAEASLCTMLESLARESSRQGGHALRLAATTTPAW